MSGLVARRFVLQNISAVASHCPIPSIASQALRSSTNRTGFLSFLLPSKENASNFSLITESEMDWIRKKSEDDFEEARIVLACRPQRSVLRGVGGALLNVVVGGIVSPLLFLSMTLERMRCYSVVTAPFYGLFWSGLFLAVSGYAAGQQLLLCSWHAVVGTPYHFLFNSHRPVPQGGEGAPTVSAYQWNALSCLFEKPCGQLHQTHRLLETHYRSDARIRELGAKRLARREKEKKDVKYTGRKGGPSGQENYYHLLGLKPDCTEKEIKSAYNKLVLKIHPDRNPSPDAAQQFDKVTKAYRVLSNPEKRKKYDVGGAEFVEDLGGKKRDAVRAVFGGDELYRLCGDTFFGSFSQRVIDGVDLNGEEVDVLKQRMYERCRDELLEHYIAKYIASYPKGKKTPEAGSRTERVQVSASSWDNYINMKIRKLTSTGLAKEVLFTIGSEYLRTVEYFDSEVTQLPDLQAEGAVQYASRLSTAAKRVSTYFATTLPHRTVIKRNKIKFLTTIRKDTFKDSAAMIDLAWYMSVEDLERTAREVSFAILYDPSIDSPERFLRREALKEVASVFVKYGQVYKGANKSTMNQLMDSLRDYQQARQKDK